MDAAVAQAIADKLYQVADKNLHFARLLYNEFFRTYSLRVVDTDLVETRDLGPSPIIPRESAKLYQVAVRDDSKRAVWINSLVWKQLPFTHQVGLIFHEAIYAVMAKYNGARTSSSSRNVTAYIFSPSFAFETSRNMHDFLLTFFGGDIFLGFKPILSNAESLQFDIENDMAKLKSGLYEQAIFYAAHAKKWQDRINRLTEKWDDEECTSTYQSATRLSSGKPIEIQLSNQTLISYTWNISGKVKWSKIGYGTWVWSKERCFKETQIVDNATMKLVLQRVARLKPLLDLFPTSDRLRHGIIKSLRDSDKDLSELIAWLFDGDSEEFPSY